MEKYILDFMPVVTVWICATALIVYMLSPIIAFSEEQTIHCGPGLGHCGKAQDEVSADMPQWERTEPGVFSLVGTSITINYDVATNSWAIKWGTYTKAGHWDQRTTEKAAIEWADKLQSLGFTP